MYAGIESVKLAKTIMVFRLDGCSFQFAHAEGDHLIEVANNSQYNLTLIQNNNFLLFNMLCHKCKKNQQIVIVK